MAKQEPTSEKNELSCFRRELEERHYELNSQNDLLL